MYLVTLELDLRFIQGKRAPLSPTGCYLALKQIRGLKKKQMKLFPSISLVWVMPMLLNSWSGSTPPDSVSPTVTASWLQAESLSSLLHMVGLQCSSGSSGRKEGSVAIGFASCLFSWALTPSPPSPLPAPILCPLWFRPHFDNLKELTQKGLKVTSKFISTTILRSQKNERSTLYRIHGYQILAWASWIFWQCNSELWDLL